MKASIIFALTILSGIASANQPGFNRVNGLPYHLTYAKNDSVKALVFFISGDGGYSNFDQSICTEFANNGYPVIGLDARKYFWNGKDAPEVVADVQKLLTYYLNLWHKSEFIFVGYSFGADAIPVIVNRLETSYKSQTRIVGLLSPSTSADLEIHITDMLSIRAKPGLFDIAKELNKLTFARTVCIYGDDEKDEIKKDILNPRVEFATVKGGHHFERNFIKLVELVLQKK
ncbi:MAG TPA: AcvB/VirJ family lysyl-phosphatidylglycerol hydrolase [Bacteroidales bacterium]|nr:AcvB/VirJ family lysyl-phosphatidylglycerol hydrolase [Bacteroidales bacterium]